MLAIAWQNIRYALFFMNKIFNGERLKKIGVESQSPLLLVNVESQGFISVYGSSQPNPMIYEVKSHSPPPPVPTGNKVPEAIQISGL
jgi:hypothetical protein